MGVTADDVPDVATGPSPTSPWQRAAGVWVLLLVLSGLVVTAGLQDRTAGRSLRAPAPELPAIGSCVVGLPAPQVVPCDGPSHGRVVSAWRTTEDDLPGNLSPDEALLEDWVRCADSLPGLVQLPPLGSTPTWQAPWWTWSTTRAHGPGGSPLTGWTWSACVVLAPSDGTDAAGDPAAWILDPTLDRPENLRVCSLGELTVPCAEPHSAELVAAAEILLPSREYDPLRDSWGGRFLPQEIDCSGLVEDYLGTEVTRPGLLVSTRGLDLGPPEGAGNRAPQSTVHRIECWVGGTRGLWEGTLAGIGDAPLPWE